jgi:hypothetical protein
MLLVFTAIVGRSIHPGRTQPAVSAALLSMGHAMAIPQESAWAGGPPKVLMANSRRLRVAAMMTSS